MVVANHQEVNMGDNTLSTKNNFSIAFLLDLCATGKASPSLGDKEMQDKKKQLDHENTMDEDDEVESQSSTDIEDLESISIGNSSTKTNDNITTAHMHLSQSSPESQCRATGSPDPISSSSSEKPHGDDTHQSNHHHHHFGLLLNSTTTSPQLRPSQIWHNRSAPPSIHSPPLLLNSLHHHHVLQGNADISSQYIEIANANTNNDNNKSILNNGRFKLSPPSSTNSSTYCSSYDDDTKG